MALTPFLQAPSLKRGAAAWPDVHGTLDRVKHSWGQPQRHLSALHFTATTLKRYNIQFIGYVLTGSLALIRHGLGPGPRYPASAS